MKVKIPFILVMALLLTLVPAAIAMAATPPLLPFDQTGDLFVLDSGSGNILRITPAGVVTIEVTKAQIMTATGESDVNFNDRGIAFDAAGNMYFTEGVSNAVLKKTPTGLPTVLANEAALQLGGADEVDPEGLAFGSDGLLYVIDDPNQRVLQVNPVTGAATVYTTKAAFEALGGITTADLESGIVGGQGGIIYALSEGTPEAVFAIAPGGTPSVLASGGPFADLDVFMTRHANGDLIVADDSGDAIYRVTPAGVVTTFLSNATLNAVATTGVDLEGGIAFDSSGNFYVAEENTDSILKFDTGLTGSIWVSAAAIDGVTGGDTDLEGGIAFAPPPPPPPPPVAVGGEVSPINKASVLAPWLGLILILAIGGGILVLRRRRAH